MGRAGETLTSSTSNLLTLAINIAALSVGVVYWDDCNLNAAVYLYYAGILGVVFAVLHLSLAIAQLCCNFCGSEDKTVLLCPCLQVLVTSIGIVRIIWGIALIFPAYETWSYTLATPASSLENDTITEQLDEEGSGLAFLAKNSSYSGANSTWILPSSSSSSSSSSTYCHYTPFMFAFASLVIESVTVCVAFLSLPLLLKSSSTRISAS